MLGEEFKEINKDLEDGAGEILNIIFGHAKTVLNSKNYGIEKAIPTVIRGHGILVKHVTQVASIVVPFETDVGSFHMEIGVEGIAS